MAIDVTNQVTPLDALASAQNVGTRSEIIDGRRWELRETLDFRWDDPWSELTRTVIADLAENGALTNTTLFEAGAGDARNAFAAGIATANLNYLGVELDDWRIGLARENLQTVGVPDERVSLAEGDVVKWLQAGDDQLEGWGVACLPQAPQGGEVAMSNADGYDADVASLQGVRDLELGGRNVDQYGLTLNAAFLSELRSRVQEGSFDLLITLSNRIPLEVLNELFEGTGWETQSGTQTEKPIQQDPDTSVEYVQAFDDGMRFYELIDGEPSHITAEEAENRRKVSLEESQNTEEARELLNVYHDVTVYHLKPAEGAAYED